MPKVSIIVPVYKAEKYIERCARSLFGQTLEDVEFVFVDDCSPDGSVEVLERVVEEFPERMAMIKVHRNERNLGAAGAKNVGMRMATGEFLMFADSDDWLDLDGVEKMYKFVSENGLDIAYCNFWGGFGRAANKIGKEPSCNNFMEGLKLFLLGKLQGTMCNKIFRRNFLIESGEWLIEGANVFEDLGWCIRLYAHRPKVGYAPLCFYHYFMDNEGSVMHTISNKTKELPDVYVNLSTAITVVENQGLAGELKDELLFAKARARDAFLGTSIKNLRRWRQTYPEADSIIMQASEPKSVRVCKWLLAKGFYSPIMLRLLLSGMMGRN